MRWCRMHLDRSLRHLIGQVVERGFNKTIVADLLNVTRKTVDKWSKRTKHLKDRARTKVKKVTDEIELFIIAVRNTFNWGTARIRLALMQELPNYMEEKLIEHGVIRPPKIKLSRPTINAVLKKYGMNGYKKERSGWKFFRARRPCELFQLDLKGPYRIQGQPYWWLVCIDDYSRYVVCAEMFDHAPTHKEIWAILFPKIKNCMPKSILTDNNPFREKWDELCKEHGVKSLHIHPYWPKDNGKVERMIKTLAEEFIYLLRTFPEWLGKLQEYIEWYNTKRHHLGINSIPSQEFSVYLTT